MTSIYNQSFLWALIISCVLLIGTCSKHERGHVMTKKSASEFKTNIGNRERAAGQLLSLLKLGISATEVMDMLPPRLGRTHYFIPLRWSFTSMTPPSSFGWPRISRLRLLLPGMNPRPKSQLRVPSSRANLTTDKLLQRCSYPYWSRVCQRRKLRMSWVDRIL